MEYFSLNGQDEFLYKNIFKDQNNGVYVDVGAYDGVTFSNSIFFEKMGWTGLCIEPNKRAYEVLKQKRKCLSENVAISSKTGFQKYIQVHGVPEMLSCLLENVNEKHLSYIDVDVKNNNASKEIIDVECVKLQSLLDKHNIHYIDYLTIDIEGQELDVVKSIDFSKTKIKVISLENNYNGKVVREYMKEIGYSLVTDSHDEIYINHSVA